MWSKPESKRNMSHELVLTYVVPCTKPDVCWLTRQKTQTTSSFLVPVAWSCLAGSSAKIITARVSQSYSSTPFWLLLSSSIFRKLGYPYPYPFSLLNVLSKSVHGHQWVIRFEVWYPWNGWMSRTCGLKPWIGPLCESYVCCWNSGKETSTVHERSLLWDMPAVS